MTEPAVQPSVSSPRVAEAETQAPTRWSAARHLASAHAKPISSVKFSRDGQLIATASADSTIKIWSTAALVSPSDSVEPEATLRGHNQGVSDVAWSRDGAYVVSASDDRTLRVWDVAQQKCVSVLGTPTHNSSLLFSGLAMDQTASSARSTGSSSVASSGLHGVEDGGDEGHKTYVFCCEFNPQGTLLASGSFDESVRIWDVRTGRCLVNLTVHQEPVSCVDFNHDGTLLATSSYDGLARIWDVATMQCLREIILEPSAPATLARFTANGQYLLVGSMDNRLTLWDYKTPVKPQCVKTYIGHVNQMYCISAAFLKDADSQQALLLSGSEDGRVVTWDVNSEKQVDAWQCSASGAVVLSLSVHPSQRHVATVSDGSLTLWTKQPMP